MIVTCDRVAVFLYKVLRDYMTFGEVEKIVSDLESGNGQFKLEDSNLTHYVENLSRRLKETTHLGIRRV